jgi:hypothetical protein
MIKTENILYDFKLCWLRMQGMGTMGRSLVLNKATPVTGHGGLYSCKMLRIPRILTTDAVKESKIYDKL